MKFITLGLAATLGFSVAPVQAALPITFNITAESGAGVLTPTYMYSDSRFEGGDRLNVQTTLRDETHIFGNSRYVYHWADTTYDSQGGYRDNTSWSVYGGDAAHAPDYIYFKASAAVDAGADQTIPMTVEVSSYISGTYTGVSDPRFPNVALYPGAVTVASADSHDPADLTTVARYGYTWFYADGTFSTSGYDASKIIPAGGSADIGVLYYLPAHLNATSYSFHMTSGLYNEGLHHFSETNYVGYEILPVPEPSTWAMLLAGVGILGIARRRKSA